MLKINSFKHGGLIYCKYHCLYVTGPGCSETAEPIAGVSKHFNTIIVSYSAEAVTLADRDTYPFFFRTVPQMNQYGSVLKQTAAFTCLHKKCVDKNHYLSAT